MSKYKGWFYKIIPITNGFGYALYETKGTDAILGCWDNMTTTNEAEIQAKAHIDWMIR